MTSLTVHSSSQILSSLSAVSTRTQFESFDFNDGSRESTRTVHSLNIDYIWVVTSFAVGRVFRSCDSVETRSVSIDRHYFAKVKCQHFVGTSVYPLDAFEHFDSFFPYCTRTVLIRLCTRSIVQRKWHQEIKCPRRLNHNQIHSFDQDLACTQLDVPPSNTNCMILIMAWHGPN